jgi:hypothetical protein
LHDVPQITAYFSKIEINKAKKNIVTGVIALKTSSGIEEPAADMNMIHLQLRRFNQLKWLKCQVEMHQVE